MVDVVPFAVAVVVCALGALVSAGPASLRVLGLLLSSTSVGAPWLLPPDHAVARATLAVLIFGLMMRAVDLQTGRWGGVGERLWHALSIVDTRKLARRAPAFEARTLALALGWEVAAVLSYAVATRGAFAVPGAASWLVRWAGGLAFVYTLSEGAYAAVFAAYRLAGFRPPPLHRHPVASRTVQEFWGRRWNLTVSSWLGETFFRPLAHRGRPRVGILAAFFVSALAHAFVAGAALGLAGAAAMMGYFLAQAAIVILELAVGVGGWRAAPARVWTLAWMALVSPAFTEPVLRVVGT